MAKLLQALGRFASKRAWLIVISWFLILVSAGTWAVLGMGKLSSSMSIKGVPAQTVIDQLQKSFPEAARGSGSVVFHKSDGTAFTADEKTAISAVLDHVKTMPFVADSIDPFKLQTTKADAEAKILDGYKKIADAKATIALNETKITSGEKSLAAAKVKLDAAAKQLATAKAQLAAGRAQYLSAKNNLSTLQQAAAGALAFYGVNSAEYLTANGYLSAATSGIQQYEAGVAAYNAGKARYDAGFKQYLAGVAALDAGKKKLEDGKATLATKEQELIVGDRLFQVSKGFGLLSKDETTAIASIQFTKPTTDLETYVRTDVVDYIQAHPIQGVQTEYSKELTQNIGGLLGIGEIMGIVIAGIVLFLMLGTFIGAGLPLIAAIIGVGISAAITLGLSGIIAMNSTTPVLGVMLGLAVGIDYALFLLNRHRKQLKNGMELRASIALANGTSGNAVVFAGLTVIIALLALNLTGIAFLGLMGDMASVAILVSILLAITLTPALMSLIGMKALSKKERANIGKETKAEAKAKLKGEPKQALVVRHPWVTMFSGIIVLSIVAIPFFSMRLGLPDGSAEPVSSTQYKAYELISKSFGPGANGQVLTIVTVPNKLADDNASNTFKADVATRLDALKNVDTAVPSAVSADGTKYLFMVIPKTGPSDIKTTNLVYDIRNLAPEIKSHYGASIGVTGLAAMNIDISQRMSAALPLYLTVVILLSILLMILVFRSIAVPVVASAGFLLSVAAALGLVVAVYQWGWFGKLTDVHDPGPIMNFLPSISIGILFGLAMDYQLFLATGMREAYVHGKSAKESVNYGLKLSRSVVLAAASIMVSVFGSFMFSESTMIRPIGFALAAGVLFDAFIVRLLLMPAALTVLGKGAWWIPKWLDRVLPDVDVEGAQLERHGH